MKDLKVFLRDLNEAFVKSNSDYILQYITDDVRWNIIGDQIIEGKDKFESVIKEMETEEAFELRINNILVQGTTAVVDGSIKPRAPIGGENTYFFCDIYQFEDTEEPLVSEITSYVVEESKEAKKVKT